MTSFVLGKKVQNYPDTYTPSLLYQIPRSTQRAHLNVDLEHLPFIGVDRWNDYEFSWLDKKTGWPQTRVLSLEIPSSSPYLIESKSLKLYLGSFTHSLFDEEKILETLYQDLSKALESPLKIELFHLDDERFLLTPENEGFDGIVLNELDVSCQEYTYNPKLLQLEDNAPQGHQRFVMRSFRSRCLITQQPDWAYIIIECVGPKLNPQSLLRYLVSFRGHCEFHEHCVERIYTDLHELLSPCVLKVQGFFTRRGSLDINPMRSHDGLGLDWKRQLIQ